ncbi:SRPBCC family protein [Streptomyces cinereoruber]|uniref:SRPBCC family protein n=1 Tax=Streptomyces cinereoruber TaxID=67260 RepID=UPI0036565E4F
MSTVEKTIDVDVPVRSAYDQWTQFEEFPHFMEGVEEVRQVDDRHCHWRTKVAGVRREFDTEIVDQLPDERVAWRTVGGEVRQRGVVTFQPLDEGHTRVRLAMEVEPEGVVEKTGDALGILDLRVKGDLKRFKGFIEERGRATGGWRGRVRPSDAAGPAPTGGTPGGVPGTNAGTPRPTGGVPGTTGVTGTTGRTGPTGDVPTVPGQTDRSSHDAGAWPPADRP